MEIQWALVLFTAISGVGAWLFASSMVGSLAKKSAPPTLLESVVSVVLLAVGGLCSVAHLKHVDRILEALNHPTSGIFVEAAMIGVSCALIAAYFILVLRKAPKRACTAVGVAGMIVCVLFTYACGSSYMMEARPPWMTYFLPLSYFATAAAAGTTANVLLKIVQKADAKAVSFAGLLAVAGACIGVVCGGGFCMRVLPWIELSAEGVVVWMVVFVVAIVVSLVCGIVAWKRPERALAIACVAVAAGVVAAIAIRVVMWLVGSPFMDFFMMPLE